MKEHDQRYSRWLNQYHQQESARCRLEVIKAEEDMKETTVEYCLGRCLVVNGERWRILEIDPQSGKMRTLLVSDPMQRGLFDWFAMLRLIRTGNAYVD